MRNKLGLSWLTAIFATASLLGGLATVSPASAQDSKRVLVLPYWLDNFNTANTSWVKRLLEEKGVSSDILNPNASATAQLNSIETAIASQNYNLIAWQPIDSNTAATTIEKIHEGGLSQVLNFAVLPPGNEDIAFQTVSVDRKKVYFPAGADAATYILAHPELGPPTIAFVDGLPASQQCTDTFESLVAGVRSVAPDAKVAYSEGATTQEQARSKMTDFITRDIPFNIFAGCGGAVSLGGIAAITAAGLGGAINKAPEHVYMLTLDGSPPELELLWKEDSSVMRAGLFGPKTAAEGVVKLIMDQLDGKTKSTDPVNLPVEIIWLTPDCAKERPRAAEQFEGVEGFTIPECSFEFKG